MPNVVLDSNILVSAVCFPNGKERVLLNAVQQHGNLLLSDRLLAELGEVLTRDKFDRYASRQQQQTFLVNLPEDHSSRSVILSSYVDLSRDPNDNHLLALAIDGNADLLVTGDKDLLVLEQIGGCPIVRNCPIVRTGDALAIISADP